MLRSWKFNRGAMVFQVPLSAQHSHVDSVAKQSVCSRALKTFMLFPVRNSLGTLVFLAITSAHATSGVTGVGGTRDDPTPPPKCCTRGGPPPLEMPLRATHAVMF